MLHTYLYFPRWVRDHQMERIARLEAALRDVRRSIVEADPAILTDTLWVSGIETAVDRIDAALSFDN